MADDCKTEKYVRWFGHVEWEDDDDSVKVCQKLDVSGKEMLVGTRKHG